MRDEFSPKIKRALADRVAWRCSFNGCHRITIGPSSETTEDILNLGEAAHITAASIGGPRYDPTLTPEQRSSIDNGIWMCRHHARMIDTDASVFSAPTLKQWKTIAENNTYKELKNFEKLNEIPSTLISLGHGLLFTAYWTSVVGNIWTFEIIDFIYGNLELLKEFISEKSFKNNYERYVVIESQGDGRLLGSDLALKMNAPNPFLSFSIKDKSKRMDPNLVPSDIANPMSFEDGDFKLVHGIESAKQSIAITLSTNYGELFYAPLFGSFFSQYYWDHKNNIAFLERLLKLECTRLVSIPIFSANENISKPALDFINRISEAKILDSKIIHNCIPIELTGEWGNGDYFKEKFNIYIHSNKS